MAGKSSSSCLHISCAPKFLRYNPYITNGYRRELKPSQCFESAFSWNNETLNIWTHLSALFFFVVVLAYDVIYVYTDFQRTPSAVVIDVLMLLSFMTCMLFSSLYHTLNCVSFNAFKKWLSLDMFGISLTLLAIFLSGIYYAFWCDEHMYLLCTYSSASCILYALAMPFVIIPRLCGHEWNTVRLGLFLSWALSGFIPTFHWVYLHYGVHAHIIYIFLPRILVMYLLSGLAFSFYTFKIPEKLWPGTFDYIGASHQLWHIFIVVALFHWYKTTHVFARYRQVFGCS